MKRYSLDVKQAADRLGMTPAQLYKIVERREIAHLRTSGKVSERIVKGRRQTVTISGRLKFSPEDCDVWTAAHVVAAAPQDQSAPPVPSSLDPLPLPSRRRFA